MSVRILQFNSTELLSAAIAGYGYLAICDTAAELPTSRSAGDLAFAADTALLYVHNGSAWIAQGSSAGLVVAEGSNATMGIATLSGGTVTVSTNKVTANSRIFLGINGTGTLANLGVVYEDAANRTAGTSFIIKSMNVLSNASVAWLIVEPAA